uniref:Moesin/ezrin/radixin homolog 1 n=1 Tax=Hirondellea gigas TaxID=1518452 RepID=A0A6A7GC00_9CRUS
MLKFGSKKNLNNENKCTIRLLDDSEVVECEFQTYHKGRYLLDFVFNHLNLIEADYFGLRYVDQHRQRHWLDPNRNILRQMKGLYPLLVCFRVKFYPCEPLQLQEEVSRYQLFLQLRRDLLHGRLYCQQDDAAMLAAMLLQAELGDYGEQTDGYVQQCRLLVRQTPKLEAKIEEIHATLTGITPAQAEAQFLRKAVTLDTYGVDPHPVKDQKGAQVYLGLSHSGLLTFQGSRKTQHFRWNEIQRLNYEGKMFIAHITIMEIVAH